MPFHVFYPFSCRVVIIFLVDLKDVSIYFGSQSHQFYALQMVYPLIPFQKNLFTVNLVSSPENCGLYRVPHR